MGGNNSSLWPYVAAATDSIVHTSNQLGWVEFDVTADVQAMLDGDESNYGWIIRKDQEGQNGRVLYATGDGAANAPELILSAD